MTRRPQRILLTIALWLIAIALAGLFDTRVALGMRDSGIADFVQSHSTLKWLLKLPGEYYFTVVVAIVVTLTHRLKWRAGGFLLLATAVSGVNGLVKWVVGRTRPFKLGTHELPQPLDLQPFAGSLFHQPRNLCFPSGHTALAFATAAAVAMLWPRSRWRWGAYAVACLVAAERVAENAHWLSDVVAGASLGVGGVWLIHWIITQMVDVKREEETTAPPAPPATA